MLYATFNSVDVDYTLLYGSRLFTEGLSLDIYTQPTPYGTVDLSLTTPYHHTVTKDVIGQIKQNNLAIRNMFA